MMLTEMGWCVLVLERSQYFVDGRVSNIHQHVCIGKSLHRTDLVALECRVDNIQGFAAVILFQDFFVGDWRHPVIVEFKPSGCAVGFDEGEIMSPMKIA